MSQTNEILLVSGPNLDPPSTARSRSRTMLPPPSVRRSATGWAFATCSRITKVS